MPQMNQPRYIITRLYIYNFFEKGVLNVLHIYSQKNVLHIFQRKRTLNIYI